MARMQAPSWDRWSGHYQQNTQYTAMDASNMMPYDPRAPAPMQTHPHAAQYAIPTTYSMASVPSMAPVSGMPPHNSFGVSYTPTSPTYMVPGRSYADDRSQISEPAHGGQYQARDCQPIYRQASPQIKSDPIPSTQLPLPAAPKHRTSAQPAPVVPAEPFVGQTAIDEMMRKIQAQGDDEEECEPETDEEDEEEEDEDEDVKDPKSYQSPPCSNASGSRCSSPRSSLRKRRHSKASNKEKRRCTWEGCKRTFTQGTHMRIHMRSHTGEKPYACSWENCHWTFSQHGNLKTHYRRHTGEKPYGCDQCTKTFAQKGNLRAHQSVHDPTKRFHCLIEGCHKPFTQRGNLKNHQNKFHKDAVAKYTALFAKTPYTELSEDDQKIFLHFKDIYKKMNQGIKGRGVGRSITKKPASNNQSFHEVSGYPVQQRTPPIEHSIPNQFAQLSVHNPHQLPQQHGLPQTQNWQNYPMPRDGGYQVIPGGRPPYEMYEMEHEPMSSTASSAGTITTPTTSIYEEDHSRGLAFRDRY